MLLIVTYISFSTFIIIIITNYRRRNRHVSYERFKQTRRRFAHRGAMVGSGDENR